MGAFFALLLLCCDEPKPTVVEAYDTVAIVHAEQYDSQRVFFIRAGKVIADRFLADDMHVTAQGPEFVLEWEDRTCHRRIHFRAVILTHISHHADDSGEWWAQQRRMTDLKEPPAKP